MTTHSQLPYYNIIALCEPRGTRHAFRNTHYATKHYPPHIARRALLATHCATNALRFTQLRAKHYVTHSLRATHYSTHALRNPRITPPTHYTAHALRDPRVTRQILRNLRITRRPILRHHALSVTHCAPHITRHALRDPRATRPMNYAPRNYAPRNTWPSHYTPRITRPTQTLHVIYDSARLLRGRRTRAAVS